jgi:hypothetical protein
MKHLRETFTDEEFQELKQVKKRMKDGKGKPLNWHDFIMVLTGPQELIDQL